MQEDGVPPQVASPEGIAPGNTRMPARANSRALAVTLALVFCACAPPVPPGNPDLPGVAPVDRQFTSQLRNAVAAKGPAYRPRTRHFAPDGAPAFVNRLILETSPYLLQHAHNPVNWSPWGDEAFDRARREGKPVFVSIGYSTCHWCHVMERESFEDVEIASFLNASFIAVKVDREERPDVDNVYMAAVQAMTGRGGWPMTVVLTPDREPFFAGTYFPARDGDRGARKGFLSVLRELSAAWTGNREVLLAQAAKVSKALAQASAPSPPGEVPGPDAIARAAAAASSTFDEAWGGFGRAPKFPRPAMLELLLRHHRRSGDARSLAMVVTTLDRMAAGGMRDHLGGGFHRYSTDREWLVPHFEKMLYDNAQLAGLYLDAWQATGEPRFADTARDTLDYLAREMTTPDGAFWSATDADSPSPSGEDEEGLFFTWTPAELAEVLGPERARVAAAWYGVDEAGNFEGRSILHRPRRDADVAAALGRPVEELRTEIASIRTELYAARAKRAAPIRDDKVVTSWNALAISAFARAALVLDDDAYLARAKTAARFLLDNLRRRDGTLQRTWMPGQARHDAVLDDYAFLVQALLDLAEADSGVPWLAEALALQKTMERDLRDAGRGGYFLTSSQQQGLLVRDKPMYDGAEPSGNAVAIRNLLRLADLLPDDAMRTRAEQDLAALGPELVQQPSSSPAVLAAVDQNLGPVLEVFVIEPSPGAADALMTVLRRTPLPGRVLLRLAEGRGRDALAPLVPALEGKTAIAGQATAYVCERGLCKQPTSDPAVLAQQLAAPGARY